MQIVSMGDNLHDVKERLSSTYQNRISEIIVDIHKIKIKNV